MSGKKDDAHTEDESLGVLDEAASVDTMGIGILGGTAQVSVSLPMTDDDSDDDVVDDDAVVGELLDGSSEDAAAGEISAASGEDSDVAEADPAEPVDSTAAFADDSVIVIEVAPEPEPEIAPEVVVETPIEESPEAEAAFDDDIVNLDEIEIDEPELDRTAPDDTATDVGAADGVASAEDEEEDPPVNASKDDKAVETARLASDSARVAPRTDVTLTSKRLGELSEPSRESADLLTSDRLLEPSHRAKPEPEGAWPHFLYTVSGRLINIGDSKPARARKQLSARIAGSLPGGARFVAVLSRKGGVGKTTVTTLLGMALADARDDRIVAVDANPDRGTLADRIAHQGTKSVRELARISEEVHGYQDISAIVGRDATRLDVIASDADPHIAEAFGDVDYRRVAEVAAHYYSVVLTDTGTGIVHSVMTETLDQADQVVIVAGLSVDEARLASETLTWLETNDRADLARDAIVVLNKAVPGKPIVQEDELEKHFASRVRHVVRMPYDPQIAAGGEIAFAELQPETRQAARSLAALVVESLRARSA